MVARIISVGEAGSFRYIGIKPPIEQQHADMLIDTIELPYTGLAGAFSRTVVNEQCEPFTEMGFEASFYLKHYGAEDVDQRIWNAAKEIGTILGQQGDEISYRDGITPEGTSLH